MDHLNTELVRYSSPHCTPRFFKVSGNCEISFSMISGFLKLLLQITRMESLHTKQQNVLRRKMEEAVASNKRLRDVMEKQRAAKKTSRDGDVKNGLAGAAERMRNFVTQVFCFVTLFHR